MPKRSRKKDRKRPATKKRAARKPERDANQTAYDAVQRLIELSEGVEAKNPAAVALGRLGGLKGGRARVDGMTKEELRASASKAARARWAAVKPKH